LPQSVAYNHSDPVERSRVRKPLPEISVPEWPDDKTLYENMLYGLRCFDAPSVSREDIQRTKMYALERQKSDLKKSIGSMDEWLKSLDMQIEIEEFNRINIQRIVQLLNKTNQMNLTTRRMDEKELLSWVSEENRKLWTFRIRDRFNDSGLVGILSVETSGMIGRIVDFVLSCRVMGRKVEETMLYIAIDHARSLGMEKIRAEYVPTGKNIPCFEFWKGSGLSYHKADNHFVWHVKDKYAPPKCIKLKVKKNGM